MLKDLNDETLLKDTKELVRVERHTTARILEYLSEIDVRRLWLKEGYSSLFDFCVRFLNYSEGEASRRIQAARIAVAVPEVKPLLEQNTISLTGLSLVAPHLTKDNAETLLPQVQNKSVREIEKILIAEFPEARRLDEFVKIPMDDELRELLLKAQELLSEKDQVIVLKKVLKSFVAPKAQRNTWPKTHTRYVPQALRREVMKEAGYECTYRSQKGIRCNQKAHLETDHARGWANGGSSWDKKNLRPLCRAHNLFRARKDFPGKVPSASSKKIG